MKATRNRTKASSTKRTSSKQRTHVASSTRSISTLSSAPSTSITSSVSNPSRATRVRAASSSKVINTTGQSITTSQRRNFATGTQAASGPSVEPILDPIIFPKAVSDRNFVKPIPMPYSRGQAWGQVLVGNHELPTPTGTWTPTSRRAGVLFTKVGMVSIFDAYGRRHGVTVLDVDDCQVIKTNPQPDRHGYINQEIGNRNRKEKSVSKPMLGHFHRARVHPKQNLRSTSITPDAALPVGWSFDVRHFMVGQYVDVFGTSTGKGFQGVMKRYGFGGQPATHGVSLTHRSLGSTGQRQDPGKVFKLKKMPGHMGMNSVVMENVHIMKIDPKRQLLFVKGQVPGPRGASVFLRDSYKKPHTDTNPPPFPTFVPPADDPMEELTLPIEMLGPDPYANGMVV